MAGDIAAVSLLDSLSATGFQASVIATYSCYFPFYEEIVLRRLFDKGCTNNILMVDARSCAEAFASEETRPRRAGRDYTLVPVRLGGAFHPKIIVALGRSKGALFVGSHNMTLAGFGLNDEITNEFTTSGTGARQGTAVIRTALRYLEEFIPPQVEGLGSAFETAKRSIPWLHGPVAVDQSERRVITTTGQDEDLWRRIRPLIPEQPVKALICGPFFDKNLAFLQQVLVDVQPQELIVGIDPESVEIEPTAAQKFPGVRFVNISGLPLVPNRRESGSRYLHAKILWFGGQNGELLVTGSANPSAPAFLPSRGRRNAEAIVADTRNGVARSLGLDELMNARNLEAQDWAGVEARKTQRERDTTKGAGTVVLAVPMETAFRLDRRLDPGATLQAYAANGDCLGDVMADISDPAMVNVSANIHECAQTLRGLERDETPIVVLIHRPDELARHFGGDRQRELRQALGALDEDPARIETLLKLTEKVIFDSDEEISIETPIRPSGRSHRDTASSPNPESLAVDAVGHRGGRRKKRLASGDILVLLDALQSRLGDGLLVPPSSRVPAEEVTPVSENDTGDDDTQPPAPYALLADTCQRKVGRLIRRMAKRLEPARTEVAGRTVVQLAAVLSVVHSLRRMEQRPEWRSQRLKLVDSKHERLLFEVGGLALAWGDSALARRALEENGGEYFDELSWATGLLVWLAWEMAIDVGATVEQTGLLATEGDAPWYQIQVFATLAPYIARDREAHRSLTGAIRRRPRRGLDGDTWVALHLALARRLSDIERRSDNAPKTLRQPIPGDLVVLRSELNPRVRVALEVVPSGSTYKITVFEQGGEKGFRKVLASHVKHLGWSDLGGTSRSIALT